jgi:hypothetical protein
VRKPNLEKLGEFVKKRMEELRLTDRDVAELSKGYVSYGTVNGLTGAKNNDIQLGSLYGIAIGIGVPLEHLIALAFDDDPYERDLLTAEEQDLVARMRRLPIETQSCIRGLVRAAHAQETKVTDSGDHIPLRQTPLAEITAAARDLLAQSAGSDVTIDQVAAAVKQSLEAAGDKLSTKPSDPQDLFQVLDNMIQAIPVPTEPLPEDPIKEGMIIKDHIRSKRKEGKK